MNRRDAVVLRLLREPGAVVSAGAGADAPSDGDLVERALTGERFPLQVLYRRHVHAVTERVTRLLSRSMEAEDVVQDAFVAAFHDLPRLVNPSHFSAWLMRIAVHQVHRRFRRRRLLARLGLDRGADDARLEQVADPALSPEQRTQLGYLDRALTHLPAELRMPWMLRHVEGCELTEVADQCGSSLATIKRRIQRADTRLRGLLGGDAAGGSSA